MKSLGAKFLTVRRQSRKALAVGQVAIATPLAALLLLAHVVPVGAHPQNLSPVAAPANHAMPIMATNHSAVPAAANHAAMPGSATNHAVPNLPPLARAQHINTSSLTAAQLDTILSSGGKTFVLNSNSPIFGNVIIPKGVTVIDFANKNSSSLTITGNLLDSGKLLFARGLSPAIQQATLSVNNIDVKAGGSIASLMHLSLNVNALSNISNAGSIISSGSLNMNAGGSISNVAQSSVASTPIIQAQNDVSLSSGTGTFRNAGSISSIAGNVNFAAIGANQSINFNNANGTIAAANAINFRDTNYAGSGDINLNGGNLYSQTLNLFSGTGTILTSVDNISGVVNASACNAHIGASTPDLKLGSLNVSGDPNYYNINGDVTIAGPITTGGADLAIMASGNITISIVGGDSIDTRFPGSNGGSAGNILMVAGGNLAGGSGSGQQDNMNTPTDNPITITPGPGSGQGSISGGSISIDNTVTINTKGTVGGIGGNGGDVKLVALAGSTAGSGQIILGSPITTGGDGLTNNTNGSVSMLAGAPSGNAITTASIDTTSTNPSTDPSGTITLQSATPLVNGTITVTSGTPSGGNFFFNTRQPGSITTTGDLTANAQGISINSGGTVTIGGRLTSNSNGVLGGNITINAQNVGANGTNPVIKASGGTSTGGTITITQNAEAPLTIGLSAGALQLNASSASVSNGPGGNITLSSGGNLVVGGVLLGAVGNATGGNINYTAGAAGQGNLQINGAISVNGGSTGDGGTVTLTSCSTDSLTFGASINNYIAGSINANAGTTGAGGSITVINRGTGGITDSSPNSSFQVEGNTLTNGGNITIEALVGPVEFGGGQLPQANLSQIGEFLSNFSLTAQSFTTFSINQGPSVFAGNSISIISTSAGSATLSSAYTFTAPIISLTSTNGGFTIGTGVINASSTAALTTFSSITAASLSNLPAVPALVLAATGPGASIGTSSSRLTINASTVTAQAPNGSVFITDTASGDVTLANSAIPLASNKAGSTFSFMTAGSSGNIKSAALNDISAANIDLTSSGGFFLSGQVIGTSSAALISTNSISNASFAAITAPSVTLAAIGPGTSIGTSLGNVMVNANNVTAQAKTGSVFVTDVSTGDLNGNVNLINSTVNAVAYSNTASSNYAFTASGILSGKNIVTQVGTNISAANAGLQSSGGFSLAGTITGTSSAALISNDSLLSIGSIITPQLLLAATGAGANLGANSTSGRLVISVPSVTAQSSTGNVFITDTSLGDPVNNNVTLVDGNFNAVGYFNKADVNGTFSFNASGVASGKSLTSAVSINAANIDLSSSGGFSITGAVTGTSSVGLISHDSITNTNVSNITTPALVLAATGPAANIGTSALSPLTISNTTVTSSATGAVFIVDNGAGNANGINLANATVDGVSYTNSAGTTFSFNASVLASGKNLTTDFLPGNVSGKDVQLTSSGGIALQIGSISATNSISLTSADSLVSVPLFTVPSITLQVTGGGSSIGSSLTPLSINSPNVSASSLSGSVFLTDSSAGDSSGHVNLSSAINSAPGGTYSFSATGIAPGKALSVGSTFAVNGADVILSSSGDVSIAGLVTGTNSASVIASGSIITASQAVAISAPTVTVVAGTGSGGNIGAATAGSRLLINASNLTAQANGSIFLTDTANSGNINLLNSNVDGTAYGNAAVDEYSLNAANIPVGNNIVSGAGVSIFANDVVLTSAGGFALAGNVTGLNSIALISQNSITSISTLSSPGTIILVANGNNANIGTSFGSPLTVTSPSVTAQAKLGSVFINDTSAGDIGGNVNLVNSTVDGTLYTNSANPLPGTGTFSFQASGISPNAGKSIVTAAGVNISGDTVQLFSNGGFAIGGHVAGTTTAAVISKDSITSIGLVSAPLVVLAATGAGSSLGGSSNPLIVSANNVTLQGSSVFVSDTFSTGTVGLADTTIGGVPYTNSANASTGKYVLTAPAEPINTGSAAIGGFSVSLTAGGSLTITGNKISAQSISLTMAPGQALTITDNALTVLAGSTGGGSISINAGSIAGGTLTPITLSANAFGGGNENGGSISLSLSSSATIGTGSSNLILHANASQTLGATGNGGIINVAVTGAGNTLTVDPTSISALTALGVGDGRQLTLSASGTLSISSNSIDSSASLNGGNGGLISLTGDAISFTGSPVNLNASSAQGSGGQIILNSTNATSTLNISSGNIQLTTNGATGAGSVSVTSGNLHFDSSGLSASVSGASGNGAKVSMIATSALTLANTTYNFDGTGSGDGGSVYFQGGTISTNALTLSANAGSGPGSTGNGGSIGYVTTSSVTPLTIGASGLQISAQGGSANSTAGNGGKINISNGSTVLIAPNSLNNIGPRGTNGSGAQITLSGSAITSTTPGTLTLAANGGGVLGQGTGDGGSINLTETTTAAQSVGSTATANFNLSAKAGVAGGNGGTVSVSTGGNLTVNQNGFAVTPSAGASGTGLNTGGQVSFTAGSAGTGNLLVQGSLNVNAAGTNTASTGGTIVLSSKSATAFSINSATALNGVQGTLSATGVDNNANNDGTITISNLGGGVTDLQPTLAAGSITLNSGINGAITISCALGEANATKIVLNAAGSGAINATKALQALNITATSVTGAITLSNVNVSANTNLSANTGLTTGTVSVTGVAPFPAQTLNVVSATGKTITISTIGDLTTSGGTIHGGVVTLKSTGVGNGAGTITVGGAINASSATLSSVGDVKNTGVITVTGSLSETSSTGQIFSDGNLLGAGATATIALTSTIGDVIATADMSAGKSITVTANKASGQSVQLGSIGAGGFTNALTVNSSGNITNNGGTTATLINETTSGTSSTININGNVLATSATGAVNLSAPNGGAINVAAGVDISAGKSISITAAKGSVSVDSIGGHSSAVPTVTLSALTSVHADAPINSLALTLSAGTTATAPGTITVDGSANLSTAGKITMTGRNIIINTVPSIGTSALAPLKINASGSVALASAGAVFVQNTGVAAITLNSSSAGTTFSFTSAGTILTSGAISAPSSVTLIGPNITVGTGSTVGSAATNSVVLTATGAGSINSSGTGIVEASATGPGVFLNSTSGSIGTGTAANTAVSVDANVVTASTTGSVDINNLGSSNTAIQLKFGASTPSKSLALYSGDSITTNAAIVIPATIILATTGINNGSINLGGNVGKSTTTTVSLTTVGSGTLNNGNSAIQAANVNLTTGTASIGTAGSSFKVTASTSISANSASLVNVQNLGTTAIKLNASSSGVGASFTFASPTNITTAGAITSQGALAINTTGTNNSIIIGSIVGGVNTSSVTLRSTGSGTITSSSSANQIQAPIVNLQSTAIKGVSGSFGTSLAPLQVNTSSLNLLTGGTALSNINNAGSTPLTLSTAAIGSGAFTLASAGALTSNAILSTAGNITLKAGLNGNVTLNANASSTGAAGVISVSTTGTGSISDAGATLSAATVNLSTASGSIGSAGTPLSISATAFSANESSLGTGIVAVNDIKTTAVTVNTSSSGTGGFILNSNGSTTTTAGNITANNSNLTIKSLSGGGVVINSTIGGASAGIVAVTTTTGGSVTKGAAATALAQGSTVNLTASGSSGSIGSATVPVTVKAGTLTVTTATTVGATGIANVSDTFTAGATTLSASAAAGNITVKTASPLSVNGNISSNSGTVSLVSAGNLTEAAAVAVTGSSVILNAGTGTIGDVGTPFRVNTGNLSTVTTAAVNVASLGSANINLLSDTSKSTYTLTSAGDITTKGAFNTETNVNLTTGSNGNITIAANLGSAKTAENFSTTSGSGAITEGGATVLLTGGAISLHSNKDINGLIAFNINASTSFSAVTTGRVNVKNTGATPFTVTGSAGTTYSLSSVGSITTVGNITAPTAVDLSGSTITLGNGSTVGGATTLTASLTATGAGALNGSLTPNSGVVQAANSVSLKSTSGAIGSSTLALGISTPSVTVSTTGLVNLNNQLSTGTTLAMGTTSTTNALTLTSAGSITTNGAITTPSSITLTASNGIILGGIIGKATTGTINLNSGNGGIAQSSNTIQASNINLSSATNIGSGTPLSVIASTSLSANSTGGLVNVSNGTTSGSLKLNTSSASTGFTLTTNVSTTLNNITVSNGPIAVTENAGILSVAPLASIQATNGSITLNNTNTTTGQIVIGASSNISTLGTGGDVEIIISTPALAAGTAPAGINFNPVQPSVPPFLYFFGTNGITATNATHIDLVSVGNGHINFNTDFLAPSAIKVNGGTLALPTVIKADPPPSGLVPAVNALPDGLNSLPMGILPVAAHLSMQALTSNSQSSSAISLSTPGLSTTLSPEPSTMMLSSAPVNNSSKISVTNQQNTWTVSSPSTANILNSNLAGSKIAGSVANDDLQFAYSQNSNQPSWISETELSRGLIPAAFSSDIEFGINSPVAALEPETEQVPVRDLQNLNHANVFPHSGNNTPPLRGVATHNANASESVKRLKLTRGAVVLAPKNDTEISTPFGTVSINAGSLVLILSQSSGLAVYDLDDLHRSAVVVSANGKQFHLSPGMNILLTSNWVKSFDQVNPAQLLGYRNIAEHEVGAGLKAFSTEFCVPTALQVVQPLQQLVTSKHPNARRLTEHLLKTTAASLQMHAGAVGYQQVLKPATTAWAN